MINYTDTAAGITPDRLEGFFVGWPKAPSPETHLQLLKNSHQVVVALDSETGRVVGFITAISDGLLAAYLPLLEVLPEYQKQGIGAELVRRMLALLDGLYMIDLICDSELRPFYERLGMKPVGGMAVRNYDRQAGN